MARQISRRRTHSARCPAFSLVELLVVIGIIAILIGLLMPTLSVARRQAMLTRCLATQREIGTAALLHAQAHQGYFPVAGDFGAGPSGRVTGVTPAMVGDVGQRRYKYLHVKESFFTGMTLAPWHAALAVYMGKRSLDGLNNVDYLDDEIGSRSYLKYFICQSHAYDAAELPNSIIYKGGNLIWMLQQSYVVNEAVFGINDKLGRLRGKAASIRRPSQTVMLADGITSLPRGYSWAGRGVNWATFVNKVAAPPITLADALKGNSKAGDSPSFDRLRHRGKLNVLFCDGHAETLPVSPAGLKSVYLLAQ
jgi:prepilin-type processing-associated H-X9-DG protein/prepilin-type N-terminal cleavage/methylation domain-containing protein